MGKGSTWSQGVTVKKVSLLSGRQIRNQSPEQRSFIKKSNTGQIQNQSRRDIEQLQNQEVQIQRT